MSGYTLVPLDPYQILIRDFAEIITRLDEAVFVSRGFPAAEVINAPSKPAALPRGGRIGNFVSYFSAITLGDLGFATASDIPIEHIALRRMRRAYVIWNDACTLWLASKIGKTSWSGDGHHAIREQSYSYALMIVRIRALTYPKLFPSARLRSRESLGRFHAWFADTSDELSGRRNLRTEYAHIAKGVNGNAVSIDVLWTVRLVLLAKELGYPEERALQLLVTDDVSMP